MTITTATFEMSSTQPYVQAGEPLNDFLRSFWQRQVDAAEQETPDYRHPPLPLARIKKVMKSDPDVKVRNWEKKSSLRDLNLWFKMIAADGTNPARCLLVYFFGSLDFYTAPILFCKACESALISEPLSWDVMLICSSLYLGNNGSSLYHRRFQQAPHSLPLRHCQGIEQIRSV